MRKILFMLLMLPWVAMAQEKKDEKYLAGAVPVENGKVIFTKTIEAPLSAEAMYGIVKEWIGENYQPVEERPNHKLIAENPESYEVTAGGEEWLVFTNRALSLDRTRMYYKINIICYQDKCTARLFDIRYWYDEEREGGERYKAEEWITDEWALNKKGTKLSRMSGKFRRKTVDRAEELFEDLEIFISRKAIKSLMK
ncbi:MAG: DUF4468 domain-containing protein [Bacteroidaceae bacterium]|nr:DUF4468 domain-containing protein [Bacteroidaceae bacterium]